jgi:hypothetical protein
MTNCDKCFTCVVLNLRTVVNTYKVVVVLMDCIVLKYEKLLK